MRLAPSRRSCSSSAARIEWRAGVGDIEKRSPMVLDDMDEANKAGSAADAKVRMHCTPRHSTSDRGGPRLCGALRAALAHVSDGEGRRPRATRRTPKGNSRSLWRSGPVRTAVFFEAGLLKRASPSQMRRRASAMVLQGRCGSTARRALPTMPTLPYRTGVGFPCSGVVPAANKMSIGQYLLEHRAGAPQVRCHVTLTFSARIMASNDAQRRWPS